MLRDYLLPLSLFAGAVVFWFLNEYFADPLLFRVFLSLLFTAVIITIYEIVTNRVAKRVIKDRRTQYTFNKGFLIISGIVFVVLMLQVWIENTESLVISYGIIAAGIAIALQDLFRNFVGGIIIALTGVYKIGDRVEVDGISGDIMDVGIMNTTMMEIRGWVDADQPTGRIVVMPNSVVITAKIYNYTKDHNFVWDEITVPLTYDSDWKAAIENFLEIVRKETGDLTIQAEKEVDRLGEKYYLPRKVTEPAVYVKLTDNWVQLGIRYVSDSKNRRIISNTLNRKILDDIAASDSYTIASENFEISGTHKVEIIKK
ncbi:MAG: mechanosensitive ion channel [Methanomicrobiaceae archaeon]|nr:mechanosensitive ion channel [Methanomicrobiaceae archaeon]